MPSIGQPSPPPSAFSSTDSMGSGYFDSDALEQGYVVKSEDAPQDFPSTGESSFTKGLQKASQWTLGRLAAGVLIPVGLTSAGLTMLRFTVAGVVGGAAAFLKLEKDCTGEFLKDKKTNDVLGEENPTLKGTSMFSTRAASIEMTTFLGLCGKIGRLVFSTIFAPPQEFNAVETLKTLVKAPFADIRKEKISLDDLYTKMQDNEITQWAKCRMFEVFD